MSYNSTLNRRPINSTMNKVALVEIALVNSLKKKERLAYETLYGMYAPVLFGVIYKIVREQALAEDLLSEAFVRIIGAIEQYDSSRGRLYTWMVNIVRNLSFDKLKSKDFRNVTKNCSLTQTNTVLNNYSTTFNPSHMDLKQITYRLAPEERYLIYLAFFKGYTHHEIASEYNIPLGTVKTRIRTAILKLRIIFGYFNPDI